MSDSPDDPTDADDASSDVSPSDDVPASGESTPSDDGAPTDGTDGSADDAVDGSTGSDDPPAYDSSGSGLHARDVEVPMRVYKTVTVFSTLIAVIFVVAGFIILDRATDRAQLPLSEVDPVLAVLGVAVMLFGAATYAFGTRFRAAGMGSSKNDDDELDDNG